MLSYGRYALEYRGYSVILPETHQSEEIAAAVSSTAVLGYRLAIQTCCLFFCIEQCAIDSSSIHRTILDRTVREEDE